MKKQTANEKEWRKRIRECNFNFNALEGYKEVEKEKEEPATWSKQYF